MEAHHHSHHPKKWEEDATFITYDSNYLLEYNNRLLDLRWSLNNSVVQLFYKNLNSTIIELQEAIADAYEISIPK